MDVWLSYKLNEINRLAWLMTKTETWPRLGSRIPEFWGAYFSLSGILSVCAATLQPSFRAHRVQNFELIAQLYLYVMVPRYQLGVYNFGRTISNIELFRAKYGQSYVTVGWMSHFFLRRFYKALSMRRKHTYEPKNDWVAFQKRTKFIIQIV